MHWRIVERGMEFGWLFIIIFSALIIPGVAHLVNLITGSRRTLEEPPFRILKKER